MAVSEITDEILAERARVFSALGDPARLRILNLIRHCEEVCNCEIGPVTGFLPSKISRHLAILKQAGLIRERREGTFLHYRLAADGDPVREALIGLLDTLVTDDPRLREDCDCMDQCKSC